MILIAGGRMIDPKTGVDAPRDLVIEGGRIKSIRPCPPERAGDAGTALNAGESRGYEGIIDARGKVLVPGFIDLHVHFRDPGFTYKEDILSGSAAAAAGGFTTVVCMANTRPVMDNPETLAAFQERAALSPVRVYTVAALSRGLAGAELTDMGELKKLGAVGFSDDGVPREDPAFLRKALLAARDLDLPVSLHEEEPGLMGVPGIHDGKAAAALGLTGSPGVSESALVARDCMIALDTGSRVHFQHLSAAASAAVIGLAKKMGARVSAELTPHHFSLTEEAVLSRGSLAKVNPPLRTGADREALIAALREGVIDLIATDHAPHSDEEKARPFREAPSGLIGLETALALGITNLVGPGHLSLPELIGKMTWAPAAVYGLGGGFLAEGGPADITIFDDREEWTPGSFRSKSSNSPFTGQSLRGKIKYTICGGKIVYQDGEA
ncbi:MAG: dihydroorotase [Treponema sp.]|jgi:dihydroorotase|nr:dihydroorotase [Treponema sp.]